MRVRRRYRFAKGFATGLCAGSGLLLAILMLTSERSPTTTTTVLPIACQEHTQAPFKLHPHYHKPQAKKHAHKPLQRDFECSPGYVKHRKPAQAVPEPHSAALMGVGLLSLGIASKRRSQAIIGGL